MRHKERKKEHWKRDKENKKLNYTNLFEFFFVYSYVSNERCRLNKISFTVAARSLTILFSTTQKHGS
jgi:hypothetical protein